MKAKKLIRYRIPVSVKFPVTHPRRGELTYFIDKIIKRSSEFYTFLGWQKLHTIRANYELWAYRFEKINRGEAVLELYYWEGKPYNSKTITVCQLSKDDGIGIQQLVFEEMIMCASNECLSTTKTHKYGGSVSIYRPLVNDKTITPETLAKNDGLSLEDFTAWFKGYDLSETMAIIHFTPFRY